MYIYLGINLLDMYANKQLTYQRRGILIRNSLDINFVQDPCITMSNEISSNTEEDASEFLEAVIFLGDVNIDVI